MNKRLHLFFTFLLFCFVAFSQAQSQRSSFEIKGSVKGEENREPISGVTVTTSSGSYTVTNGLGEFKIKAIIGDELMFESFAFETVTHIVKSSEDVDVRVRDYTPESKASKVASKSRSSTSIQQLLDSANYYKKTDIENSIDFVTKAIVQIGREGDKDLLSKSYTTLGEIYHYHKQYDLAVNSFKEALLASDTVKTELLLAQSYLANNEYVSAQSIFLALAKKSSLTSYQKAQVYEGLGDANKGLGATDKAIENYSLGLNLAKKKSITPKITDLNSKIADAYADDNQLEEAEVYYDNSLELSKNEAPQRAVQEKEKVADFYNKRNEYDKEVSLRKKSLEDLKVLNSPQKKVAKTSGVNTGSDSISSQRIKYKIGNALLSQQKYDQAIPYLIESIDEASVDDDLVVQKDATRKLSEVYKYQGDFNKALETYQEYVSIVDTLYVRKEQEISRATRLNREIATKQNRISGLEKERELYQSKYDLVLTSEQLVERQKWLIYSLVFGMLLLGLTTYFFYRSNKQQKLANNLLALKSLRSQMNPHFIFNALNSVNNYIAKSDERSANRYLSDFSTLMRAVLENSEEDFIPLTKEIELLELYTKLEHSRFADKFDYEIKIDEEIDIAAYQIPPMLLQPYIENAIWHGLRYKDEKGFLKISVKNITKNSIEITIIDNGIGRKKSTELKTNNQKKQKSKGMGNIKKRIDILNDMYKDKVDVVISDYKEDGTGTQVSFSLNKEQ
ncbi:signal transduction histidine kinase, LytS [Cellulophaga algicola DSM 14237]|uniref:Signal transduction histidine kinase, LytS n=1 Tax=Cellulophaga algicola (strain DSM 14237 / IC166 / ACAM 630) TaxID=688270 RepID=E6X4S3_CELAD|nr:histidine kinase [Cellulophaga algicola]ADV49398.1 signal transduction histidine kinase, LytS [Cellulophaga algicola DSM 14237]